MARRTDLSVLRRRVQDAIDALTAGGISTPERYCTFLFSPTDGEDELEISREAFFDNEAPPGRYAFEVRDDGGNVTARGEGIRFEIRGDAEERHVSGQVAFTRAMDRLLQSSSSEVERIGRRLLEEEARSEKLKADLRVYEQALREREGEIAQLQLERELGGGGEFAEAAEIVGQVLVQALGLDLNQPAQTAKDFEVVIQAVRKSPEAQRAIKQVSGEEPLRRLLEGGAS